MKRLLSILAIGPMTVATLSLAGAAPTGDEIMKKVRDRKLPENSTARFELTIKRGDSSVMKVFKAASMKISEDESHSLVEFEKPNNTKVLAYTRKSGEDDRWVKTSSGAPKRISTGSSDQAFAQSDFTYGDMDFARAKDFKSELLCDGDKCESDFKGAPHYRVKSTPAKSEADYAYVVNLVKVSDSTVDKIEFYSKDGKLMKEMTFEDVKDVSGFRTPMAITIKMADSGNSSVLKILSIEYNSTKVSKQMFDKNLL